MSSASAEWSTPADFFAAVSRRFGPFDLDVAATAENAKAPRFFTRAENGLAQPWAPARCWMNPPYGREIRRWLEKARAEALDGEVTAVCLVPARTDPAWFHEVAVYGSVIF